MASSLNVIALISGGKDSLFSILHCQANGHSVVALANLHPAPSGDNGSEQDTNSYMYQTVGHSVIPLYEQALGLPLYRREITGTAVNSSRDYAVAAAPLLPSSSDVQKQQPQQQQQHDETEDLVPLLQRVMQAHPEANAVSTGAILSTYQRTRVESVALRLGLTPLSYLWQYPLLPPYTQSSLLHDMCAVGQEAIIIKTASGGLDESFLGLDVAAPGSVARLARAVGRFGDAGDGAILGEGGEFETLALDGPRPLWKKKISIHSGAPLLVEGGQTVLRVQASAVEDKTGGDEERNTGPLRIPELFDEEFARILEIPEFGFEESASVGDGTAQCTSPGHESPAEHLPRNIPSETPTVFTYANLTSDVSSSSSTSPSRQLTQLFLRLDHILQQRRLSKASVNHCTLLLRDMSTFTLLNPLYAQYFTHVNPPARVTIAVGDLLSKGVDVMLSVVIDKNTSRQGLHVQGRSYWAPANIGPYSQAISTLLPQAQNAYSSNSGEVEVVYVAGQIPLVPASMDVYSTTLGFKGQATLSLQHLWRIGRAKNVKWWSAAVAFIPSSLSTSSSTTVESCVRTAQHVWRQIHLLGSNNNDDGEEDEDDEDIDPWDRLNTQHGSSFVDTTIRAPIPSVCNSHGSKDRGIMTPPCFVAQVESLPRGVDIEWSATGLASSSSSVSEPLALYFSRDAETPYLSRTSLQSSQSRFFTLEIRGESDVRLLERFGLQGSGSRSGSAEWAAATLYVSQTFPWSREIDAVLRSGGVQWVPCQRVWGEDGREVSAVFVGRRDD